jgi:hypothetical protein
VTARRPWAALGTLCGALALAAASAAERPAPVPSVHEKDAGAPALARDAGAHPSGSAQDGGQVLPLLSPEDTEVVENLELLEHLQESDVLDLLLSSPDE